MKEPILIRVVAVAVEAIAMISIRAAAVSGITIAEEAAIRMAIIIIPGEDQTGRLRGAAVTIIAAPIGTAAEEEVTEEEEAAAAVMTTGATGRGGLLMRIAVDMITSVVDRRNGNVAMAGVVAMITGRDMVEVCNLIENKEMIAPHIFLTGGIDGHQEAIAVTGRFLVGRRTAMVSAIAAGQCHPTAANIAIGRQTGPEEIHWMTVVNPTTAGDRAARRRCRLRSKGTEDGRRRRCHSRVACQMPAIGLVIVT
jgi:hypothetical protein